MTHHINGVLRRVLGSHDDQLKVLATLVLTLVVLGVQVSGGPVQQTILEDEDAVVSLRWRRSGGGVSVDDGDTG